MSSRPSIVLPSSSTLTKLAQLSIRDDKPLKFDYWLESSSDGVFIGVNKKAGSDGEQMLVKTGADEFTSPIQNMYKSGADELIVVTENSIYVVSSKIKRKAVTL